MRLYPQGSNDFRDITFGRAEGRRAKPYFVPSDRGYRLCGPDLTWMDYTIDHSDLAFLVERHLLRVGQADTSNIPDAESPRLMAYILQEMKTTCAQYGIPLTILLFERLEVSILTEEILAAFRAACAQNGVVFANITDQIRVGSAADHRSLLAVDG